MSDIVDGLARIRLEFLAAGLRPPMAIMLESPEEGHRFLSEIRQSPNWQAIIGSPDLGIPVVGEDAIVRMTLNVMGISVQWPAKKYALRDGVSRWS